MLDLASPLIPDNLVPRHWRAEHFLAALHPAGERGQVSTLSIDRGRAWQRTWPIAELDAVAVPLAESEAYVALNRFYGPRGGGRRLAALNCLWLDLDTYRVPALDHVERPEIAGIILRKIAAANLPPPSFLIDSGRGYYCIWLIRGAVPAARPRWTAAMRALVEWARPLGADPACIDAARVLRLPDSWHLDAGRQVTVVNGAGDRHDFDLLADAIWQATGRPTREAVNRRKAARTRRPRQSLSGPVAAAQRGLPRRCFWKAVLADLEVLLESWGGAVPAGLRDLWLHAYACALTWTSIDLDLTATVVARAAVVAPGLPSREVRRMIGTTVRRAVAAVAGQRTADGRDPRYDYSGGRLAELLGIDRPTAEELGLQQIIPPALREHRYRQRRIGRRRSAGVLPRSIWLALNPTSRERPWDAEGISRATWYRRRRHEREQRRQRRVSALLAGTAAVAPSRETGMSPLYGGEAPPSAPERRPEPLFGSPGGQNPPTSPQTPPAPTVRLTPTPESAAAPGRVLPVDQPHPDHNEASADPARQETPDMPSLADPHVLAIAARRLSGADLGHLTRIAAALAEGGCSRLDLTKRARVHLDDVLRLGPWLRWSPDGLAIVGLEKAPSEAAPTARGPRQGNLFDQTEFPPPPAPVTQRSSIKAAVFAAAIEALGRAGISNTPARRFLGGLLRDHSFGAVAEAVEALSRTDVADPRSWIKGYIRTRYPDAMNAGAGRSAGNTGRARPNTSFASEARHPEITPEFLGVSSKTAAEIREKGRRLAESFRADLNT